MLFIIARSCLRANGNDASAAIPAVNLFAFAGIASVAIEYTGSIGDSPSEEVNSTARWFLRILIDPLLGFAFLFATFYGYSRMAEGTALLVGCEVPRNFDKPHLARDLGDFWKRWHRSMADFVMQYIYLPLLVTTSPPRLAVIVAFVLMGLWHDFTLGFLIWGFGLGVVLLWARRHNVPAPALRVLSLGLRDSAVSHRPRSLVMTPRRWRRTVYPAVCTVMLILWIRFGRFGRFEAVEVPYVGF